MFVYPLNFAASSSLGSNPRVRDALNYIQRNYKDNDTHVIEEGTPFISILDLAIQINNESNVDITKAIGIILGKISRFVRVNFNKPSRDARNALKWIGSQDKRLAVWCSCKVAREALRYIPKEEVRPLQAILTAENWVRGQIRDYELMAAAGRAIAAGIKASAAKPPGIDVEYACYAAARAAQFAYGTYAYSDVVTDAAYAAYAYEVYFSGPVSNDEMYRMRTEIARSLTAVVADAVLTFPV